MSVAVFIIVITTNSSSGSRNITITATTTIVHLSNWICANFIFTFHFARGEYSLSHSPHAREQLHEAAIPVRRRNHQIGRGYPARLHVDQTEDEGGEGESRQTQRRRVGELALLDGAVQTGLELTPEGGEALAGRGDLGEGAVPEAGSGLGDLALLVGHGAGRRVAVGSAVGEVFVGWFGHSVRRCLCMCITGRQRFFICD
ncbi:hypothetical protein I7I50_09543 [Histoplasma capsulatum G186AR]|uniref:Uncharacterized protein n=1 Tax=Ajellomyces capsulatus TaxID=5037 RepID=A0A8H8D1H5_AJECA|nr:hypothetical protein I7I52_07064 [Histoplasma capsulatum]QSS74401.1 hypothetical protein I7I50_09543 [Histoplasma capsulatum G186AR]